MRFLVIGYGSTLRRDDGVGAMIAEQLMEDHSSIASSKAQIEVISRQQLTPDLADAVAQSELVVFIDASADATPGLVQIRDVVPKGENWGAFVHEMSPEVLLDCVKELFGGVPRARLITIGGEDFSIGEGLTPTVQSAIPRVLDLLRQEISA